MTIGANTSHGLRRTNADKRRAVEAALSHPAAEGLSDRAIARHCGVSREFVTRRKKTNQQTPCDPITTATKDKLDSPAKHNETETCEVKFDASEEPSDGAPWPGDDDGYSDLDIDPEADIAERLKAQARQRA